MEHRRCARRIVDSSKSSKKAPEQNLGEEVRGKNDPAAEKAFTPNKEKREFPPGER